MGVRLHCWSSQFGYEFATGRRANPPWMKPAFTVMAGLVPAIRSGRVPRPLAGTGPAMTMGWLFGVRHASGGQDGRLSYGDG